MWIKFPSISQKSTRNFKHSLRKCGFLETKGHLSHLKIFIFIAPVFSLVEKVLFINTNPLISRVRGPYGNFWTEFSPSFYGPSAKRAGHENKEGKNEDP